VSSISKSLRQQVINEAGYRCEYCRTSSRLTGMPLVMDHILPSSLGGNDERENLAACCYRCNEFKGAKITANDPVKNESISLFNPRLQRWLDHFQWANGGTHIIGITAIGRGTVLALRLNNEDVVQARAI
jgi:5-methylcytosine-specific restriction endonuclease McrA